MHHAHAAASPWRSRSRRWRCGRGLASPPRRRPAIAARRGWCREGTYCPRPLHRATRSSSSPCRQMESTPRRRCTPSSARSPASSWSERGDPSRPSSALRGIGWGRPLPVPSADRDEPVKQRGRQAHAGRHLPRRHHVRLRDASRSAATTLQLAPRPAVLRRGREIALLREDRAAKRSWEGRRAARNGQGRRCTGAASSSTIRRGRGVKAGSCIFLHVWERPARRHRRPIGLPEERVAYLQEWAEKRFTAIAIVHEDALASLQALPTGFGRHGSRWRCRSHIRAARLRASLHSKSATSGALLQARYFKPSTSRSGRRGSGRSRSRSAR